MAPNIVEHSGLVKVDPAGDLIIEVTEYYLHSSGSDGVRQIRGAVSLKVASQLLLNITSTEDFKATLTNDIVRFEDDTLTGVYICMFILHYESPPDFCYNIGVEEVHDVFGFAMKCGFNPTKFREWFGIYYSKLEKVDENAWRAFLYPTWLCNMPGEFAEVSRALAFTGSGQVTELMSERYPDLHVPSRIIEQINRAKANMKRNITEELLDITDPNVFCPDACPTRAASLTAYLSTLSSSTDLYPLSNLPYLSISQILDGAGFKNWVCDIPAGACESCRSHMSEDHIISASVGALEYWEGLCLDCVRMSKKEMEERSWCREYFAADEAENWDYGCKIEHGRISWFHSFMGKDDDMNKWLTEQMEKENGGGGEDGGGEIKGEEVNENLTEGEDDFGGDWATFGFKESNIEALRLAGFKPVFDKDGNPSAHVHHDAETGQWYYHMREAETRIAP